MDNYYKSDKFRRILQQYEESNQYGTGSFLDSEELTDVAEYYHLKGRDAESYEVAELALSILPGSIAPLAFLSRMALLVENNIEKAEEIAESIIDKNDIEYFYLKSEILIVGEKAKEASEYLEEHFADVDEDDKEYYIIDSANLFADYEEMAFAEEWLKKSGQSSTNEYKEIQARILRSKGNFADSEKIFNELIDSNPYAGSYWNYLAQSQFLQSNFNESITSSEYAIAIDPEDEEAILNKANGLFSLGNYEEALKYYERYKQLCQGNDLSVITVTIGHIHLILNDIPRAYASFEEAIKTSRTRNATMIQIAMSVFDNGHIAYAYQLLKNNLPFADKEWIFGYAYYARCCYELGKMDEFPAALEAALRKNPDECKDILGDLYPPGTTPFNYPSLTPDHPKDKAGTQDDFPFEPMQE